MKAIDSTLGLSEQELIALCRYYKGESEMPYDDDRALLWYYECKWVEFHKTQKKFLEEQLQDYYKFGYQTFSSEDGVPVSLKAVLFNRYMHWSGYASPIDNKGFMEWYKKYYLRENLS
ncbi:MAG: hypothetical protein LKM33_01310 [Bacteroidales bacterium]|jgi:hypothetical protein|nr:hypothetical protein [Bacteroidales bacterium]